jgi:hypothetical protein
MRGLCMTVCNCKMHEIIRSTPEEIHVLQPAVLAFMIDPSSLEVKIMPCGIY